MINILHEIEGLGTWPMFENEMPYYVLLDVILVELKNCSNDRLKSEVGENQYRLVREQSTQTRELCSLFGKQEVGQVEEQLKKLVAGAEV